MTLPLLVVRSRNPPSPPPTSDTLIVGFFEDGQNENTSAEFSAAIADLVSRGLNGFMFTVDAAPPAISDAQPHFYQIQAPMTPLYALYPSTSTVVSDATARAVIDPLADAVLGHPSVIGLNIRDDAVRERNAQFIQEINIFHETVPSLPISPLIRATGRDSWEVYDFIKDICFNYMGYEFPFNQDVSAYEWTQNGRYHNVWWNYMRLQWQLKPQAYPLWLNLQGHETVNTLTPDPTSDLRQPAPGEICAEMWIAFGEEANAICVYIYSTVTGGGIGLSWTGIKDLPTHYDRIEAEAAKLLPLENNYRIQSTKIPDRFSVTNRQYISTFRNDSVADVYYVVVVNTTGSSTNLQVTSLWFDGDLLDLTTAQTYGLGEDIPFVAGEGRMFQLINFVALTPPSPAANKITNGTFETLSGGFAASWTSSLPTDTAEFHSGTQSAKPATGATYSQTITSVVAADKDYYFSFWEKHEGLNSTNQIGMRVVQTTPNIAPNNEMATINWRMPASSNGWRKIIGFFRTNATGTGWRIDIVCTYTTGNVWIDDVFLQEAGVYSDVDEYLIERLTLTPGITTFRPSDYGTVTGTNATTDTALIQAAIDAAVAFDAPCRVLLEDTYAVGARGGKKTIGANRNVAYGFCIPELAHDIEVDMTGAAFVYTQVPSLSSPNTATSYELFMIGQGWDIDVDGSWGGAPDDPNWLTSRIRYTENITILAEGCTWDSSLLSDANLQTLSGGVIGGCIQFHACLNCSLDGCDIDRGYGHTGTIGCNTWTRYLTVTNCTIGTSYLTAFWFDGVWDSVFTNLSCHDFVATASTSGLVLAPNTDNRRVSERNVVTNCDFTEVHDGIVMQGSFNTIDGCDIILLGDNVTHEGFLVQTPASTERGTWECDGNTIRNCTVNRPSASPSQKGYGVKLKGSATSFVGGVIRVVNTLIDNCNFGSATEPEKLGQGVNLSTYAVNNTMSNTIVNGTALTFDDSGGTATGNSTATGNTLT